MGETRLRRGDEEGDEETRRTGYWCMEGEAKAGEAAWGWGLGLGLGQGLARGRGPGLEAGLAEGGETKKEAKKGFRGRTKTKK